MGGKVYLHIKVHGDVCPQIPLHGSYFLKKKITTDVRDLFSRMFENIGVFTEKWPLPKKTIKKLF